MVAVPRWLFRGDADERQKRQLRDSWCRGYLLTNLANHGVGKDVFSAQLKALVVRHINGVWSKTHFLSFSDDRDVAERFARGRAGRRIALLPPEQTPWDSSVLTVDTSVMNRMDQIADGFYRASFRVAATHRPGCNPLLIIPHALEPAATAVPERTLLLVDVVRALEGAGGGEHVRDALAKARRDAEWLLLPTDLMSKLNAEGAPDEFTAKIETTVISSLDKYRWDP